jgi:hypothetical protein
MQPESQQERLQPELRDLERDPRGIASATQIADRLVLDGWHGDTRQIARAEQAREGHSVASIGFDLVTRLLGNERRRNDLTVEPLARQNSDGDRNHMARLRTQTRARGFSPEGGGPVCRDLHAATRWPRQTPAGLR